jgi:hypothetical protein
MVGWVLPEQGSAGDGGGEYELKFVVPLERARAFLRTLQDRLRVTVYDRVLPVAFARTTYLDTPDWRYLRSSAAEVSRRLRIRQYAAAPDDGVPARLTGLCFIEYKESAAGRRRKARLQILPYDIAAMLADPAAILSAYRHRDGDAADVLLGEMAGAMLAPQLMTWYRRQSLVDSGGLVRVTLDTEIAFAPALPLDAMSAIEGHGCEPVHGVGQAPECLLELKYDRTPPDWLAAAVGLLGAPPAVRLSKYVMGMQIMERAGQPRGGASGRREPASRNGPGARR